MSKIKPEPKNDMEKVGTGKRKLAKVSRIFKYPGGRYLDAIEVIFDN